MRQPPSSEDGKSRQEVALTFLVQVPAVLDQLQASLASARSGEGQEREASSRQSEAKASWHPQCPGSMPANILPHTGDRMQRPGRLAPNAVFLQKRKCNCITFRGQRDPSKM